MHSVLWRYATPRPRTTAHNHRAGDHGWTTDVTLQLPTVGPHQEVGALGWGFAPAELGEGLSGRGGEGDDAGWGRRGRGLVGEPGG